MNSVDPEVDLHTNQFILETVVSLYHVFFSMFYLFPDHRDIDLSFLLGCTLIQILSISNPYFFFGCFMGIRVLLSLRVRTVFPFLFYMTIILLNHYTG